MQDARAGGSWGKRDLAEQLLVDALASPHVAAAVRSDLLADRAALAWGRSPGQAQADIDRILAMDGARGAAVSMALYLRAKTQVRAGREDEAIADLSAALAVPEASPLVLALCRQERAALHSSRNEHTPALEDLDAALEIKGVPDIVLGLVRFDRAVIRGQVGDVEGEIQDYTRVLKQKVPGETRVRAHFNRGIARRDRGDRHGATKDFIAVRDDPASPAAAVSGATAYLDELDPLKSPPGGATE